MRINNKIKLLWLLLPFLIACDNNYLKALKGELGRDEYLEYIDKSRDQLLWLRLVPVQWDFHPDKDAKKLVTGRLPYNNFKCLLKAKRNLQKKANTAERYYLTYDDEQYIELIVDKDRFITKVSLVKGKQIISNTFHVFCKVKIDDLLIQKR
ncbi:hypothetical protein BOO92_20055 [Vibrio navarrensis]|uniref:hypothetical protein n=1 Tax=Vibrio TaxID=662 RepID=UPI00084B4DBC|nr:MULTISPECIES: hypothetical protein [Vibrio]MBE3658966.1 hypothetical protein [Vibrio navarrensis]MBE4605954.1 hypothetical protein [Vibrio navarrensis]ODW52514.1 hypothetical protein BBL88_16535 [Vibrio parahaemolyticus]